MGKRFSATVQTGPGAHPASYTVVTVSFPGLNLAGSGFDHPTPSSAKVKERVVMPLLPLWVFVVCSRVTFTFTFYSNENTEQNYKKYFTSREEISVHSHLICPVFNS